jgi:hypothetical protein
MLFHSQLVGWRKANKKKMTLKPPTGIERLLFFAKKLFSHFENALTV